MKKFILLFLCCFLMTCCKDNNDRLNCEEAHLWDYPDDWRFIPIEQREDALQIPENIINCLSTEELMDLCLRYPLLENIFSFDLLDDGLDQLFAEFNGVRKLYQRKDVTGILLERYKRLIQNLLTGEPIHISIFKFDVLLSRVEEQDVKTLTEILRELLFGYEIISMMEIDNKFLLPYNFFSRAHLIIKISDEYLDDIPQGKNNPVFTPAGADSETADIINQLSYQLTK